MLESTKLYVFGANETISFLFKIPILKPHTFTYSKIYPVPNAQDVIVIPPKNYAAESTNTTLWTDEQCKNVNSVTLCLETPTPQVCTLQEVERCPTAKVTNPYDLIYPLSNGQILVMFKEEKEVIEDCDGIMHKKQISGSAVLSSSCRILVGEFIFTSAVPVFYFPIPNVSKIAVSKPATSVHLLLKHLESPSELIHDVTAFNSTPLILHPVTSSIHLSISLLFMVMFTLCCVFVCRYRTRLHELIFLPRRVVTLRDIVTPAPVLSDEDVSET